MLLLLSLLVLMPLLLLLLIWNKWVCRLCLLGLNSDDFISNLRLLLDHQSFWPLSEPPPGQLGIAAVPFYSYCRIELSGLPVAIKTVSAIEEVSRPAIEAAVYFGWRGMILVTPLVYGFNFRGM
ncbi:uncharacterized protein LOC107624485 isoform X2 [Arachis ipaensis]|uniref:uncharacterized protein LOC107624485 isoform X2 n=1 Tax=Arachis ipaensis TaxID=130454 RepID=UPI0007AFA7BA|nr:uncharacterized protein LOC107624485 isoform X2 [Arachis ipaensis]